MSSALRNSTCAAANVTTNRTSDARDPHLCVSLVFTVHKGLTAGGSDVSLAECCVKRVDEDIAWHWRPRTATVPEEALCGTRSHKPVA